MDFETGEDFIGSKPPVLDRETGESPGTPKINSETGETELNLTQPEPTVKKPFKIPNEYTEKKYAPKPRPAIDKQPKRKYVFTNTEASNSPILLFMLPTIFFFFPIVTIPLGILEVILHTWAHKKNKTLRDEDIYYQSPMHVFVSEFCAACKFESAKNRITKIQDIRNRRNKMLFNGGIECVRSVV